MLENWAYQLFLPARLIQKKYSAFEHLRTRDVRSLELISQLEEIRQRNLPCDIEYIKYLFFRLNSEIRELTASLSAFHPVRYALLDNYRRKYAFYARLALVEEDPPTDPPYAKSLGTHQDEELAGGKGSTLSYIRSQLHLPTPRGLVITTQAFGRFLQDNNLREWINSQLARLGPDAEQEYGEVSRNIQARIMQTEMPDEITQAVWAVLEAENLESASLAVRSSAVAEDRLASFAGQYESLLHVPARDWVQAYKSVLASKYSAHALYYRVHQGYTDQQTSMAVIIMPMLEAAVSGILYTRREDDHTCMDTYMVRGSGQELAAGSKYQAWTALRTKGQSWEAETSGEVLVDADALDRLYQAGQILDQTFGSAQDVEWVLDTAGRLFIVQSRPLHFYTPQVTPVSQTYTAPVLGQGQWVSSGQVSGTAYWLQDDKDWFEVPAGCILVVKTLPPELTPVLNQAGGVLAEQGSPACHFASVAREAQIPVLCNVSGLQDIAQGTTLSVDADQGLVLAGAIFHGQRKEPPHFSQSSPPTSEVQRRLERALPFLAALHLRDPNADDFSIQGCKSLHDIVRFGHESGVREMFSLVGRRGLNRFGAKRLESGLPLVLHVLDVGQGLIPEARGAKVVRVDQIQSRPLLGLWAGLSAPAVQWDPNILHYDWDAYYKSTSTFTAVEKSTQFSSYAILARDYVHAMLRFGYHFAVVDAVVCTNVEHNYLQFSFKGGGGNDVQRQHRLQIIASILEHFDFRSRLRADMLEAWFERQDQDACNKNLQVLGFVLGKTVLLDMRLENSQEVDRTSAAILDELNDFLSVQTPAQ
jgi:pyruvate,water dikinase